MRSDQTPNTPAVTESLRERMRQAAYSLGGFTQHEARMMLAILDTVVPIAEAELQKHTEEKARLVGEFRRLAAKATRQVQRRMGDWTDVQAVTAYRSAAKTWEGAAQMLEESKP